MKRRAFLKWGGTGLFAAGLFSQNLFSASSSPLRELLFSDEYPFPYDEQYFDCAERIYNVRRSRDDPQSWQTNVSLFLKEGKKLDIKIRVSDTPQGLSSPREVHSFTGVTESLDVLMTGFDSPRLHYQVQYREGQGSWKALSPKSFRLPNARIERGEEIKVILIADDHTFDDASYQVPAEYKNIKLSGDYVNEFLKKLRNNPNWEPDAPLGKLTNGLFLAKAIRLILAQEDPHLVINLGDTNGIGASYRWKDWGLPYQNLTEADYDYIARTLWLRMRKIYSGLTPVMPVFLALGNHDGEEGWNSARFKSREWREKYFPLPDETTYPEGGHPDGNYHAFSWGSDEDNRGGVQFIILDVTAFTGNVEPRKVEAWTLGEEQLKWLREVLEGNERDWSFICFHHVLGGWPAGPEETDNVNIAYGRGPLFNPSDYSSFCDPNKVEQVKITEMAAEYGARGFLYGHDHIFHVKKIGKGLNQKEILSVCGGSTKSIGEAGWWRGNLWMKYYGNAFKPNPDFWGPPGITRLTVKNEETRVDYLVVARTHFSNLPSGARPGDILFSTILPSPSPSIVLDKTEIVFQGVEGRNQFPDQVIKVRNGGGRILDFSVKTKASWLSVSPQSGKSWGKWKDITLSISVHNFSAGTYEGTVSFEDSRAANSPQIVRVKLEVIDPPIYPPVNFKGERKEVVFYPQINVIFLSWKANRLNRDIRKYRVYILDAEGQKSLLNEVLADTYKYIFVNALKGKRYRFALTAVDSKNREGEAAFTAVD
ncbi:MAG: metallophosphoesterase [Candidatus Aminicenantales bacterium]